MSVSPLSSSPSQSYFSHSEEETDFEQDVLDIIKRRDLEGLRWYSPDHLEPFSVQISSLLAVYQSMETIIGEKSAQEELIDWGPILAQKQWGEDRSLKESPTQTLFYDALAELAMEYTDLEVFAKLPPDTLASILPIVTSRRETYEEMLNYISSNDLP